MNQREFFYLCYDQYKGTLDQADVLYQRASVVMAALPILGAAVYGIGRTDLLPLLFARVDTLIYYLATLASICLLAASAVCLFRSILPRRQYQTLASMKKWQGWREDYEKLFTCESDDEIKKGEETVGRETLRSMIPLVAGAQETNAMLNEKRRQHFGYSVRIAGLAVIAIAVQAAFALLLHLQGVNP